MRKVLLLAWREYSTSVRTKAFLIMVVVMPILMSGSAIAYHLFKGQKDTTDKHIAVIDRSGVVADAIVAAATERNESAIFNDEGRKVEPAYVIEVVPPNGVSPDEQRAALSDRVERGELAAFIEIGKDVLKPDAPDADGHVAYYAPNAALDDARGWLGQPVNDRIRSLRIADTGLDPATARSLFEWTSVEAMGLVKIDKATGHVKEALPSNEGVAIGIPALMLMLMFLMIMVGATPLVNAVLEEKMQRIAEVLLGSVKPFQLMLGKLLGTLGVSFTVLLIYAGGGAGVAYYLGVQEYIPFEVLPWFVAYMIAAIMLFGSMLVALGAACNDLKEAQSMLMPVWLLVMIPMFVWINVVKEPTSDFATWMSLIPPFTPILMLVRQTSPVAIPAWQPWVGLAGVLLFTVLCVWAAGRIFRIGLLMQGKPPKPRDLLRWAIRG